MLTIGKEDLSSQRNLADFNLPKGLNTQRKELKSPGEIGRVPTKERSLKAHGKLVEDPMTLPFKELSTLCTENVHHQHLSNLTLLQG